MGQCILNSKQLTYQWISEPTCFQYSEAQRTGFGSCGTSHLPTWHTPASHHQFLLFLWFWTSWSLLPLLPWVLIQVASSKSGNMVYIGFVCFYCSADNHFFSADSVSSLFPHPDPLGASLQLQNQGFSACSYGQVSSMFQITLLHSSLYLQCSTKCLYKCQVMHHHAPLEVNISANLPD